LKIYINNHTFCGSSKTNLVNSLFSFVSRLTPIHNSTVRAFNPYTLSSLTGVVKVALPPESFTSSNGITASGLQPIVDGVVTTCTQNQSTKPIYQYISVSGSLRIPEGSMVALFSSIVGSLRVQQHTLQQPPMITDVPFNVIGAAIQTYAYYFGVNLLLDTTFDRKSNDLASFIGFDYIHLLHDHFVKYKLGLDETRTCHVNINLDSSFPITRFAQPSYVFGWTYIPSEWVNKASISEHIQSIVSLISRFYSSANIILLTKAVYYMMNVKYNGSIITAQGLCVDAAVSGAGISKIAEFRSVYHSLGICLVENLLGSVTSLDEDCRLNLRNMFVGAAHVFSNAGFPVYSITESRLESSIDQIEFDTQFFLLSGNFSISRSGMNVHASTNSGILSDPFFGPNYKYLFGNSLEVLYSSDSIYKYQDLRTSIGAHSYPLRLKQTKNIRSLFSTSVILTTGVRPNDLAPIHLSNDKLPSDEFTKTQLDVSIMREAISVILSDTFYPLPVLSGILDCCPNGLKVLGSLDAIKEHIVSEDSSRIERLRLLADNKARTPIDKKLSNDKIMEETKRPDPLASTDNLAEDKIVDESLNENKVNTLPEERMKDSITKGEVDEKLSDDSKKLDKSKTSTEAFRNSKHKTDSGKLSNIFTGSTKPCLKHSTMSKSIRLAINSNRKNYSEEKLLSRKIEELQINNNLKIINKNFRNKKIIRNLNNHQQKNIFIRRIRKGMSIP
jgi:hypothetical protein